MNFGFLEAKEKEVEKAVNWESFQDKLNQVGFEFESVLRKFLASFEVRGLKDKLIPSVLSGLFSSNEISQSTVDIEIRSIIESLNQIEGSFYHSGDGEEEISKLSLRLFDAFGQKLIDAETFDEKALLISKILIFSSPTEMAVTLMTHYADLDPKLAALIGDGLVQKVESIYRFQYKDSLSSMEKFQTVVPFLRTMVYKEQMQIAIILASSLKDKLILEKPQLWLDISPLFKLCIMRHTKGLDLNSLSEEDKEKVSDNSIKDALAKHEDIAMDLNIDIKNMPSIIFRRYQDRTVERVTQEYLSLFREFTGILPSIKDAHVVVRMLRYLQDYLLLELGSINANCLMVSELTGKNFAEQLVVTIDMLRESVALNSDNELEISCFEQFIKCELLPVVLANGDLLKYVDENISKMAIRQVNVFYELLNLNSSLSFDEKQFVSKFACDSPYRFLSVLNWIVFADIEGEIEFLDKNLNNSSSDFLFTQAMMLSWVIRREIQYNKLLVVAES